MRSIRFPSKFVVVSLPAIMSRIAKPTICASVSVSAESATRVIALTRSSPGAARRVATRPAKYWRSSSSVESRPLPVGPPSESTSASDQRRKFACWLSGTPIMPAITATGSGAAIAATRSISCPCGMRPVSSCASVSMAGRMASMLLGVKARASSARSTEWRGGSSVSSGSSSP
jgi:hypothetical protein